MKAYSITLENITHYKQKMNSSYLIVTTHHFGQSRSWILHYIHTPYKSNLPIKSIIFWMTLKSWWARLNNNKSSLEARPKSRWAINELQRPKPQVLLVLPTSLMQSWTFCQPLEKNHEGPCTRSQIAFCSVYSKNRQINPYTLDKRKNWFFLIKIPSNYIVKKPV